MFEDLSLSIQERQITLILGPNGCGKSTLLNAMSGLLSAINGEVQIGELQLSSTKRPELAKRLAILPQHPIAPQGLSVFDLVARGRTPHQDFLHQWRAEDQTVVERVLERVDLLDCADKPVNELSGGQRQRAWIALVLAQQTDVMFFDEPTSALDPRHQLDIFLLLERLRDEEGKTIVAVVHDLNIAARFADYVIAMRDGKVLRSGSATEVFTPDTLHAVFDLECRVFVDEISGALTVVPLV
ncbi:MAG: ABC transporter ATP-binding protein [Pseudomonadota bacterium]